MYSDPIFDSYATESEVAAAVNSVNAELLTDVALKLAEGERILVRKRKHFSAEDLFELAIRISMESGDHKTLARLGEALEMHQNSKLLAKAKLALSASSESRTTITEFKVSLDTSVDAYTFAKVLLAQIKHAVALGDSERISFTEEIVKINEDLLGEELVKHLKKVLKDGKQNVAANFKVSTEGLTALRKLSANSRYDADFEGTNPLSKATEPNKITGGR